MNVRNNLSLRVCLLESRIQRAVNSILKIFMDHVRGFIAGKNDPSLIFMYGDTSVALQIEAFDDQETPLVGGSYATGHGLGYNELTLTLYTRPDITKLPEIKKELMITLYHELEHAAQNGDLGFNLKRGRSQPHRGPIEAPMADDSPKYTRPPPPVRGGWLHYHFSPWEQEARVTEMARLAKLERVSLATIFKRFADEMVAGNELSRRQADMLIKDWELYATKRGFGKKLTKRVPVPPSV